MSCQYTCDGCGKVQPAKPFIRTYQVTWHKPSSGWRQLSNKELLLDFCSIECLKKISEKTGKTKGVVTV